MPSMAIRVALALSLIVATTIWLPAQVLSQPAIGIATQPESGPECHLSLPMFELRTWYIVADLGTLPDFHGAEFRITGWNHLDVQIFSVTAHPSITLAVGNPFEEGTKLQFTTACEPGPLVTLFTVQSFAAVSWSGAIQIDQHTSPSSPLFPCPVLFECDAPTFTAHCATELEVFVNNPGSGPTLPSNPTPSHGASGVDLITTLEWHTGHPGSECVIGVPSQRVYFGTAPDPPLVGTVSSLDVPEWNPGPLTPNTTYYWRTESVDPPYAISGPEWTFTTLASVAVEEVSWSRVRQMYR